MWPFKKKKQTIKLDFDKYSTDLTIKSICLYEHLSGKAFNRIETEEDVYQLVYASLITNNSSLKYLSYNAFKCMMADLRVQEWLMGAYTKSFKHLMELFVKKKEGEGTDNEVEDNEIYISKIAANLIVKLGLDARYVMEDMELWEFENYFEVYDDMEKTSWERERLWTYLDILPHIDSKKLKGPEKLLPFPWETENKKKKEEDELKKAKAFFNNRNKEESEQ